MDFQKLNPDRYQNLLDEKIEIIKSDFKEYFNKEIEVFASEPLHFRARSEFRVWHEGDDLYFYMFDKVEDKKIRLDQYVVASKLINEMMLDLISHIKNVEVLRRKLFQVDFLSTKSGEILVTLIYHKKLDDEWTLLAQKLKGELSRKYKVNIVGRSKQQKINLDCDYVIEKLPVDNRELIYQQVENSFTQPNTDVAIKMLEWAIKHSKKMEGDLLELYCGNGNFSIALAPYFKKVLATEISKSSVQSAQFNIKENKVTNLDIIRMSAEEFTQAFDGVREFTRLKGIVLSEYDCQTILVDPPRAGLDEKTVELVKRFKNIIYISCNPQTLLENLKSITETHAVDAFALFDQFPYTHHLECGVILKKK